MKLNLIAFTFIPAVLLSGTWLHAQGDLAPAGAPAPTMKSLQEIWERINANQAVIEAKINANQAATEAMLTEHRDATEATIAALQAENAALKDQNATIQQLLASLGLDLPWQTTTIDSVGKPGRFTSLSFDPLGNPAISYYDFINGDLKFASFDGQEWHTQIIDHVGNVGGYTSLSFDPSGNPAISYYDFINGDLKFAFKAPFRGGR